MAETESAATHGKITPFRLIDALVIKSGIKSATVRDGRLRTSAAQFNRIESAYGLARRLSRGRSMLLMGMKPRLLSRPKLAEGGMAASGRRKARADVANRVHYETIDRRLRIASDGTTCKRSEEHTSELQSLMRTSYA